MKHSRLHGDQAENPDSSNVPRRAEEAAAETACWPTIRIVRIALLGFLCVSLLVVGFFILLVCEVRPDYRAAFSRSGVCHFSQDFRRCRRW